MSTIDHPSHYALDPEPIDVIEAWGLGFHAGNALKYIARAGRKGDAKEDLLKAVWYCERAGGPFVPPLTRLQFAWLEEIARKWGLPENLALALPHICAGALSTAAGHIRAEVETIRKSKG